MSVEGVRVVLAIRAQHLTTAERFVLLALAEHASTDPDGELVAYPSGTLLALETGLTREYVQACLKRLRDLTAIRGKGKRRRVNVYALNMRLIYGWTNLALPGVVSAQSTPTCQVSSQESVDSVHTEPPSEPPEEPSIDGHGFDAFWDAYPRKVSKVAARRMWPKVLKLADAETVIAGAKRYANDPNRTPQFTKHPTTWLNKGCWDDEPEPQRGPYGGTVDPKTTHHDHWSTGGQFAGEEG